MNLELYCFVADLSFFVVVVLEFGVIPFCCRFLFFVVVVLFFIIIFCFNKLECLKKKNECQLTAMFVCEFVVVEMMQSVF